MPVQAQVEDPDYERLYTGLQSDYKVSGSFSDKCDTCGHSRADHLLNPSALNLNAVNQCQVECTTGTFVVDTETGIQTAATGICPCISWKHD